MKSRPLSVTLISYLFIVAGTTGIIYHASELREIISRPEVIWVFIVRVFAIVSGLFALQGFNLARWLLVLWIAYHFILSFYHSNAEIAMHGVIMLLVVVSLFHTQANNFFRRK